MKFRNITIGVVVGGVIFAGGVAAVVWQKGLSIRETVANRSNLIEDGNRIASGQYNEDHIHSSL